MTDDELEQLAKEIEELIFIYGYTIKGWELRKLLQEWERQGELTPRLPPPK